MKAISESASREKILTLASEVSAAQLRVINVKESQMKPVENDKDIALIAKIKKDREHWEAISNEEIVEIYKQKYS